MALSVCTHGQLERSCELCERDKHVAALESGFDRMSDALTKICAERDALAARVASLEKLCPSMTELETGEQLDNASTITAGVGYLHTLMERRDALAELVREVLDGHYDMRSEFVASPDWISRARAALEGKP